MVQKRAGSRMDVLLLGLIDYPRRVEAVSLYEHESRRRGILDRKDYFDVPCALHGWLTELGTGGSPIIGSSGFCRRANSRHRVGLAVLG
jgi:hypothetical protein